MVMGPKCGCIAARGSWQQLLLRLLLQWQILRFIVFCCAARKHHPPSGTTCLESPEEVVSRQPALSPVHASSARTPSSSSHFAWVATFKVQIGL